MLCYIMLCDDMICCVMSCYDMLCHVILCCDMLCYVILHYVPFIFSHYSIVLTLFSSYFSIFSFTISISVASVASLERTHRENPNQRILFEKEITISALLYPVALVLATNMFPEDPDALLKTSKRLPGWVRITNLASFSYFFNNYYHYDNYCFVFYI